jgi:sarcosine oxidase subunit gamma
MLTSAPRGEGVFAAAVKAAIGAAGSTVDQSHGRCMITLTGSRAQEVLSRLTRIDLHPSAFGPARAAVTPLAEMFCVLHHAATGSRYEMIVFSTFADSFLHSVITAAATTGYEVV